jgi:hypothetical protein
MCIGWIVLLRRFVEQIAYPPPNHHHRQRMSSPIRMINPIAVATIRLLIDC